MASSKMDKQDPKSPSNFQTKTSFLSLPREIRQQILEQTGTVPHEAITDICTGIATKKTSDMLGWIVKIVYYIATIDDWVKTLGTLKTIAKAARCQTLSEDVEWFKIRMLTEIGKDILAVLLITDCPHNDIDKRQEVIETSDNAFADIHGVTYDLLKDVLASRSLRDAAQRLLGIHLPDSVLTLDLGLDSWTW